MNFEYEVAVSFAGEQRSEVAGVVECLKKAGVRVFYDEGEKVDLWGKDLYVHFAEIYSKRARYCVLFASREYAEKVWTNHERQNAQARAILEKGKEYILPVRFDDTEIPGLPGTIGYLEFRKEGAKGICDAVLAKLGQRSSSTSIAVKKVNDSRYAMFMAGDRNSYFIAFSSSWGEGVHLEVESDTAGDVSLLNEIKSENKVALAYGPYVELGRLEKLSTINRNGKRVAEIEFVIEREDFGSVMEMGTSSTSAEEFAEIRARRLLLNLDKAKESKDLNAMMQEALVRGQDSAVKIKESPFPGLFKDFGSNADTYLNVAWITAVMYLKLGNVVAQIDSLEMSFDGTKLQVRFAGKRRRKYSNVPPHVVEINGTCDVA